MPLMIHPVVLVGKVITCFVGLVPEKYFQPTHAIEGFCSGCLLWLATVLVSVGTAWCVLMGPTILVRTVLQQTDAASSFAEVGFIVSTITTTRTDLVFYLQTILDWLLHVFLLRGALSLQLLCNVAIQMAHFLEHDQLGKARQQLSWLCSRDPSDLRADELAGATLESLSENLSDSVVSPLFYYVLFGPLGALAFRVMNTLDSRVGYRGRCEWVGKFSARVDDLLNLIPARLTSLLLVLSAACLSGQRKGHASNVIQRGLGVAWRDASQCDSPNAGWPMATMAGILGVRLEKRSQYSLNGPKNGGCGEPPNQTDVRRGHTIAQFAGIIVFILAVIATWLSPTFS